MSARVLGRVFAYIEERIFVFIDSLSFHDDFLHGLSVDGDGAILMLLYTWQFGKHGVFRKCCEFLDFDADDTVLSFISPSFNGGSGVGLIDIDSCNVFLALDVEQFEHVVIFKYVDFLAEFGNIDFDNLAIYDEERFLAVFVDGNLVRCEADDALFVFVVVLGRSVWCFEQREGFE